MDEETLNLMDEKNLTLAQNIHAARIFLNTFNLILENKEDINEFSEIKIFNKSKQEVGKLVFTKDKVMMFAQEDYILNAQYNLARAWGFVDIDSQSLIKPIFGKWSSEIIFQVNWQNNIQLSGKFLLECSADSELGLSCLCHPLVNLEIPGQGKITLNILRDGSTFRMDLYTPKGQELIDVRPWDWLNGFFIHDIKEKGKRTDAYRKYAGIFNGAEQGENQNKLHVFLKEEEKGRKIAYRSEFIPKIGDDNSKEILLQKGKLMHELDPEMYEKIAKVRNLFSLNNESILDNLIGVCYDSYTDEEINVLLGLKRNKNIYQDGRDNLKDSYFSLDNASFLGLTRKLERLPEGKGK